MVYVLYHGLIYLTNYNNSFHSFFIWNLNKGFKNNVTFRIHTFPFLIPEIVIITSDCSLKC